MFTSVYLVLVALAAAPLMVRLALLAPGQTLTLHQLYGHLLRLGAVALAIILLEIAFDISLQNYWFDELGQQYRYWLVLGVRLGIFLAVVLVVGLFAGLNLRALGQTVPGLPRSAPWLLGFLFAAVVGWAATSLWTSVVAFLGGTPSGTADPVFGKDLSFYLLALPLYDHVVGIAHFVMIVVLLAWGAGGMMMHQAQPSSPIARALQAPLLPGDQTTWVAGTKRFHGPFSTRWLRQGALLAALYCLVAAADRVLGRFHLVIDGHSGVVAGASYVDVEYWIPVYAVIIACWLAAALLFAAVALSARFRGWVLAAPARWAVAVGGLVSIAILAGMVPGAVERVYVQPNQITLEQPYLVRSIAGTRHAFNIEAPTVEERDYDVSSRPLAPADLDANAATLRDARIWDWRALEPQLQQIQGLRPYYLFSNVDIDRYRIDGTERQVMLTARELDFERLPAAAQVWVNLALTYTHGYGVVAVPTNEVGPRGNPVLWAHDIPVEAKGSLAVTHGQIYFGRMTHDRVYVHTTEKEFDYPRGDANVETEYGGSGGVALSSFWRRLVVAHAFDGLHLFISGYITLQSRVLFRRNIVERTERLAPFLTFDHDPYVVADGDHYSFIIDAYTSSVNHPYSEAYAGSRPEFRGRNYVRNSVKAVVDAYNGSVTFYVFDDKDPIIRAWRRMLPGLFRDAAAMPDNLRRHIRYPEDLFIAQAEMYGTYHMTNPTTFYNREDRWQVPHELYRDREIEMAPYYVFAQLPGGQRPEFLLMLPMSVYGKNQMSGWLAGLCDGANYGKMVAFRFPKGRFVDGPAQVESRINSDSRFSANLTLWDQHGSRVIRGNLIVLPLADEQLIAIEPIYIEAEQTKIPTLTRVVLAQLMPDDRRIEWAPSLKEVEALMVGAPLGTVAAAPAPDALDHLARARAIFEDMRKAYAAGDFARYGELLQDLGRALAAP
ncbi:MAG: UPF0182 family protein [Proteobacteria bacterium]|nr:UPF0182 family protein [Pseudomonadota bacterium]